MPGGYMGKMLLVDLTEGTVKEEPLQEELCRNFIGGHGLGVRILYERMKAGVAPLGAENWLGFVTGPLTGTGVPMSPRFTVVTKSPLTGTWAEANVGGYFGPELKAAGYDAIFISGVFSKPVYLLIHEGGSELKDAEHLWGKDTAETSDAIQHELGDSKVRVVCIGPSGEALSLISSIVVDKWRIAGRMGVGAVMGSKRLKAIAVRGTKKVPVANSSSLASLRKDFLATGVVWSRTFRPLPVSMVLTNLLSLVLRSVVTSPSCLKQSINAVMLCCSVCVYWAIAHRMTSKNYYLSKRIWRYPTRLF